MRILAIKPDYPSPPRSGGSITAFHQLRLLAKQHTITLVCQGEQSERDAFAERLHAVELVPPARRARWQVLARCMMDLLLGIPIHVSLLQSRQMSDRVAQLLREVPFDAVLLYDVAAVQYCPPEWRPRAVLNLEDPQSRKLDRMSALPVYSPFQRWKLRVYAWIMSRYEQRHLQEIGRVTLLSESDVRDPEIQGSYKNIAHVPYAQEPADVLPFAQRTPGMIVFSGNMFHSPNVDAALYFLRNIYARVLEQAPTACLWIVGARPDERIRAAAQPFGDRVCITGQVPEVSDYVRRAMVSICPVRLKIGTQTKVLEAWSLGTPVVSTPEGNAGTRGTHGEHLWVESKPQAFADRIVRVLHGDDWEKVSRAGRQYLSERFSWEASASRLEDLLRSVVR
jgi:glycosyltransferase involved in cell wall biosynthesis